jgi:hypothetical protein
VFALLALTWLLYVGEFLQAHRFVGFLNHPQIQLPYFNSVPAQLEKDARAEK